MKCNKEEKMSIVTLTDGTKIMNSIIIPEKKQLRKWIAKAHPEYLEDCIKGGEFEEEEKKT